MNWQEACAKSAFGRAFRDTEQGRVFRHSDGFATFKGNKIPYMRVALPEEIEGFTDWEPILPAGEKK